MARSVRAVSAPQGATKTIGTGHTMRMLSGSIGAAPPMDALNGAPLGDENKFEGPQQSDDKWAEELRRREIAAGVHNALPAQPPRNLGGAKEYTPAVMDVVREAPAPKPPLDIENLPDRFTLEIEKKKEGWWKVTAPLHHVGLYILHKDLLVALADAPGALSQLLRLDGAVPAPKRGRKSK